jgi:phosphoribosyl 1,2-cyclic phosphate phosphodiesterase
MNIEITILGSGTSQGVPVIACDCNVCVSANPLDKRLRSSVHINVDGVSIVIDTGPDFRQQMLRENIQHLDAILVTHSHKDHVAGLDDVRAYNFKQKKSMDLYASQACWDRLKMEYDYVFASKKYPGVPSINDVVINETESFFVQGMEIIPILVWHYKMPVFGFRIGDFTYVTDANRIDEKEFEKIKGSKVFILNALQKTEHISHFTLSEAIAIADKVGAEQTYFTHISHKLGKHEEEDSLLPQNMNLAFDGLKIKC